MAWPTTRRAAKGVLGRAHDWFPAHIERGVDDYRAAGEIAEAHKQSMINRVGVAVHGLNARRVVDVRDGRDLRANGIELVDPEAGLFLGRHGAAAALDDIGHHQHVRGSRIDLEPVAGMFAQDRWCERAE